MTETIVVLDAISQTVAERLRTLLPEGFELSHGTEHGDAHLARIIAEADYAISGQVAVSGAVLRAAPRLKLLHKWGVGVDNLDVEAARALGIKVARTTGSNSVAVAEFTIGLMICALRHIPHGHFGLQNGNWQSWRGRSPFLLSGKTVGLVGFGAIGKAVARLLSGFGCTIVYNKRHRLDADEEKTLGVAFAELPELLARSDVVSLHCPLTPATAGLIDRAALASMKPTAVLVNVARGGVVAEQDLARGAAKRRHPCRRGGRVRGGAAPRRQPPAAHRQPHPHPAPGRDGRGHLRAHGQAHVRKHRPRLSRGAASGARRGGAVARPFPAGSRRRARMPRGGGTFGPRPS